MSEKANGKTGKDRTRRKAEHSQVARWLLVKYRFATMKDTRDIYVYDKTAGLYKLGGDIVIEQEVQRALIGSDSAHESTTGFVNSVKGFVQRETFVNRNQLDAYNDLILVKNGVLDLRDPGKVFVLPFSPGFLFTVGLGASYDPKATCPRIATFLCEVARGDDVELLIEIAAWCLDLDSPIQRWVLLWGEGTNGKSTFMEFLRTFLGKDNCSAVMIQQLLDNRFALASLFGKRANLFADVPSTGLKATGLLKALTGGDTVRAEKKFQESFDFRNRAKLIFSGNTAPAVRDDTEAFWRRLILVDFPNWFPPEKADPHLLAKLTTERELSGFLNLVLKRRAKLRERNRFTYALSSAEVRERYFLRSDTVEAFVEDACLVGSDEWGGPIITKEALYRAYAGYTNSKGLVPATKIKFGRTLKKHLGRGIREGQDKIHQNVWHGICLKSG